MKCPDCERPMTPLFFSCVCDFCDGLVEETSATEGFVVLRGRALPAEEYVFQFRAHAELWKQKNNLTNAPILPVRAPRQLTWRKSTGSLQDVVTADRLVTIYPDRKFPPEPNRAYLVNADG